MVFFMPQDGVGAVELLKEEEAHHLVVEGELRERHPLRGSRIDLA